MNYIVGNSHALWPAKPGSMGRPYPGHRIAVIDDDGREVPRGRARRGRGATASRPTARPTRCSSSSTSSNPEGTRDEVHRRLVPHRRRRDDATPTATSGTRAAPTTCSRRRATASARRRSRTASSGIRRSRTPRSSRRPTRRAATSSRRSSCSPPGHAPSAALEDDIQQHVRELPRALRVPEGDRVHRRAADDDDRQGAAAACCASGSASARRRAKAGPD